MSDFTITITSAGRAALVNAANTGTAPVTITQCGVSETAFAPDTSTEALPGEIKRITTLSGDVVADDTIHLIVRDESADSYSLRSIALYLNTGELFGVYSQAEPIMEKSTQALLLLAVDVQFADVDATLLTFGDTNFLNPPATETRQGVAEIATQTEATAGTDDTRIVTPKKARASFLSWLGTALPDVWRASNDGAGSGLDADLLDGQQGSWYSNIAARLGFTPVNKAGDTMGGKLSLSGNPTASAHAANKGYVDALVTAGAIRSKLQTVDGAGSGIDADLLDGQHGNYYTNIPARLGYTPLNSASYTAADVRAKLLSVDGPGSGVNADLLDGKHASAFADMSDFGGLFAQNGYYRFPNGLLVQWGRILVNSDSYATLTFPVAFPNVCLYIGSGVATEVGNGNAQANCPLPYGTPTKTTASFFNAAPTSTAWWLALGH